MDKNKVLSLPPVKRVDKIYYTYKLISSLDDKVFYVGKGSGNRCLIHLKIANSNKCGKNRKLYNKIRKILKSGGSVVIEKVYETYIEKKSF